MKLQNRFLDRFDKERRELLDHFEKEQCESAKEIHELLVEIERLKV